MRALGSWLAAVLSAAVLSAAVAAAGCSEIGDVATDSAVEAADFGGAKADAHCDRRFVTAGGEPAAFCQEIAGTVAAAEFADDCRAKHKAAADSGLCPRSRIIAGCVLHKETDDESRLVDWYYDVSDLAAGASPPFESRPSTVADVAKMCAEPSRYEEGAELVLR
jgi:hypothetical protein